MSEDGRRGQRFIAFFLVESDAMRLGRRSRGSSVRNDGDLLVSRCAGGEIAAVMVFEL